MAEIDIHRGELSTDPIDVTVAGETHHLDGGWTYLGHPVRFKEAAPSGPEVEQRRSRRSRFDRRSPK